MRALAVLVTPALEGGGKIAISVENVDATPLHQTSSACDAPGARLHTERPCALLQAPCGPPRWMGSTVSAGPAARHPAVLSATPCAQRTTLVQRIAHVESGVDHTRDCTLSEALLPMLRDFELGNACELSSSAGLSLLLVRWPCSHSLADMIEGVWAPGAGVHRRY